MTTNTPPLTTAGAAERLGLRRWQIARLFERGLLPPAPRMGLQRAIAESELPAIEEAARKAGYLPAEASEPVPV